MDKKQERERPRARRKRPHSLNLGDSKFVLAVTALVVLATLATAKVSCHSRQQQQQRRAEPTGHQRAHEQEAPVIINVSSLIVTNWTATSGGAASQERASDERELHAGAKITLCLLGATIALVAAATAVDCRMGSDELAEKGAAARKRRESRSNTWLLSQCACLSGGRADEQRSASAFSLMSSSSGSSASSSSSTLAAAAAAAAASTAAPAASSTAARAASHNFGLQLLLAFSLRHSSRQIFAESAAGVCARPPTTKRGQHQRSSTEQHSRCAPATRQQQRADDQRDSAHANTHGARTHSHTAAAAGQYVDRVEVKIAAAHRAAHSRQAATDATSGRERESIAALHGLRFLSMIWVIVIHSYNFALRWMYFSNTSSLANVYESLASQLLANGSFACDSFFFVGGFLLPYLALGGTGRSCSKTTTKSTTSTVTKTTTAAAAIGRQPQKRAAELEEPTQPAGSVRRTEATGLHARAERVPVACACSARAPAALVCCCAPSAASAAGVRPARVLSNTNELLARAAGLQLGAWRQHDDNNNKTNPLLACYCPIGAKNRLAQPYGLAELQDSEEDAHNQDESSSSSSSDESTDGLDELELSCQLVSTKMTAARVGANLVHRYARMMPLMMAIIGLSVGLLRYLGDGGAQWTESTMMFDHWCRSNWWVNALFLHNFVRRENMCLSHSWYSAVDLQLFVLGQLVLLALERSRKWGLSLIGALLCVSQLANALLTLVYQLPAMPLLAHVSEQTMNLYYGEIYIKPYCRASPYLIGMLLAYLLRTTRLAELRLSRTLVALGWLSALGTMGAILLAMRPAINGQPLAEWQAALYSSLSRPLWACALAWIVFACATRQRSGPFELVRRLLSARCFFPLSRLTYPAFLVHPIVMAIFYGSRQSSFHFSHYLMLYLILGNIVITYACAFVLASLFELPLISLERTLSARLWNREKNHATTTLEDATDFTTKLS